MEKSKHIFDAANLIKQVLEEWTTPNQIDITAPNEGKWNQMTRRISLFQEARYKGWRLWGRSQETGEWVGDVTDWQHLVTKYLQWNWKGETNAPKQPPPSQPNPK